MYGGGATEMNTVFTIVNRLMRLMCAKWLHNNLQDDKLPCMVVAHRHYDVYYRFRALIAIALMRANSYTTVFKTTNYHVRRWRNGYVFVPTIFKAWITMYGGGARMC